MEKIKSIVGNMLLVFCFVRLRKALKTRISDNGILRDVSGVVTISVTLISLSFLPAFRDHRTSSLLIGREFGFSST